MEVPQSHYLTDVLSKYFFHRSIFFTTFLSIYAFKPAHYSIACKATIMALLHLYIISFNFSITISTSFSVLNLLKEKRTVTRSGLLAMARITWLPVSAPLLHALPPLVHMLLISIFKRIISLLSVLGKFT